MSKVAQLKKKAAECEQKKQYERALGLYVQAIEAAELPEDRDIQLFNRVGDLFLRQGDLNQAITYYERAVDLYTESGFFSNAIALCNKVLRHSSARSVIYYKLGKISAKKGFNSDAKQNFLEYAGRMQRDGQLDEAFRALKEFADLCPGQDDVRLMLADQLVRAQRPAEALEQLQLFYQTMVAEDRAVEAQAALERIRAIDPEFAPSVGHTQRPAERDGLVFIDIRRTQELIRFADRRTPASGVRPQSVAISAVVAPVVSVAAVSGVESSVPLEVRPDHAEGDSESQASSAALPGLELTSLVEESSAVDVDQIQMIVDSGSPADASFEASPLAGVTPVEDPFISMALAVAAMANPSPDDASGVSGAAEIAEIADASEAADNSAPVESVPSAVVASAPLVEEAVATPINVSEAQVESPVAAPPPLPQPPVVDSEFVDLNEWLQESQGPRNTRMTTDKAQPEDGTQEQSDFTAMLETFKQGIALNVDESDSDSHYDLGVAYLEMGLLTEAVAQFQKALRGNSVPERRVRAYESLGQCFIEQEKYDIARASLAGAFNEPGFSDDKLVGVLYWLGYAAEFAGDRHDAIEYYKRVVAIDITFRDVSERLGRATQIAMV